MLLPNLILLIDVTFSTSTGVITQNPGKPSMSDIAIYLQLRSNLLEHDEDFRPSVPFLYVIDRVSSLH
jgi:hypothetical protein